MAILARWRKWGIAYEFTKKGGKLSLKETNSRISSENDGEKRRWKTEETRRLVKAEMEAERRREVGEVSFQVEGARVGEITSPLRGLRVSGRQGPWREGSLYFKLKGNSKYRPLSQSPCASPGPLSFSLFFNFLSSILFSDRFRLLPSSRAYIFPSFLHHSHCPDGNI